MSASGTFRTRPALFGQGAMSDLSPEMRTKAEIPPSTLNLWVHAPVTATLWSRPGLNHTPPHLSRSLSWTIPPWPRFAPPCSLYRRRHPSPPTLCRASPMASTLKVLPTPTRSTCCRSSMTASNCGWPIWTWRRRKPRAASWCCCTAVTSRRAIGHPSSRRSPTPATASWCRTRSASANPQNRPPSCISTRWRATRSRCSIICKSPKPISSPTRWEACSRCASRGPIRIASTIWC